MIKLVHLDFLRSELLKPGMFIVALLLVFLLMDKIMGFD